MADFLFGIDLASQQGFPDWVDLATTHDYMLTKITGEGAYVNPNWRDNHDAARAAGLIPGGYDWYEPHTAGPNVSGADLAAEFLREFGWRMDGSLVAVDFESPLWNTGYWGASIEQPTRQYLYTLKEQANKPILVYAGDYFLQETGAVNWEWLGRDFLLWRAAPGDGMVDDTAPWYDGPVAPFPAVTIHQHQWHATGPYVQGEYDRNRTNLTRPQLYEIASGSEGYVLEPQPGKFTSYVNANGNTIVVINYGGTTDANGIRGTVINDAGVTVCSAHDPQRTQESRSVQNGVMGEWHESPIE